tara:strand:- start:74 stop:1324 length:1251 start_codon:yes stop_codon:yes gene_type:complete
MHDYYFYLQIFVIFILILSSGFFSSSETALTSISESLLQKKVTEGDMKAFNTQILLKKKEMAISAILLGNNLVNILSSALATNILVNTFGPIGILYSTISMTSIIFIFAEVLPKIYAIRKPDKLLIFYTPYLKSVIWILSPINHFVNIAIKYLVKNKNTKSKNLNLDRIRGAILIADKEGVMFKDNKFMLESILDLNEREISEVMIHRKDIFSISKKENKKELLNIVNKTPYSRIPIWDKNPENIVGVILVKDLLRIFLNGKNIDFTKIIQKPWFIPETTSLSGQLNAFREKQQQIAFVVDEYGVLQGLVTLEDILEEIVGQIEDEHDTPSADYESDNEGNIYVDGNATIRDLNRLHNLKFPEEEASTISGLIMNLSKRIPQKGEYFYINDYLLTVRARTKTRVTRVHIYNTKKIS